jgi:hypothetical protein
MVPVSVTISPSANNICAGTLVTFTPTPVNGGTPAYQWFKNTILAGTGTSYSFVPGNGDQVYAVMTSSLACKTGSPATSNTVTMIVNPVLPVSVSIVASANPVEAGAPVTFTATAVNGGTSPSYQWKLNGINTGDNNASFTFAPANGDIVSCMLTSSETCASSNPANSNIINMVVNSVPSNVNLQNVTVSGNDCFNAVQTIVVAGNGNFFTVQSGGNATMIAGENILFYPGTVVEQGGYMRGYIASDGPWCAATKIVSSLTGTSEVRHNSEQPFFSIYPSPTTGAFIFELNTSDSVEKCLVEIFDMMGNKVSTSELPGAGKHRLSLAGRPAGVYLIRVLQGKHSAISRIIKLD